MSVQVTRTVSGSEPIDLATAKAWLKMEDTIADDTLITSLITQSRELVEQYLNISIPTQTVVVTATPRLELMLPYRPIVSITSVKDRDAEDLDYTYNGFTILFSSTSQLSDSITTYESGYASSLPSGLLVGLKEILALLYENRGDEIMKKIPHLIRQNHNLGPYNQNQWFK